MTLSEKMRLFQEQSPVSEAIPEARLPALGIQQPRFLRNCVFEESVNLCSPVIARSAGSFIGAHSYMNDGGYMRSNVFVGRFCSIGRRVSLGAGMHPLEGLSTHPFLVYGAGNPYSEEETAELGVRHRPTGPLLIGNDVWIGDGSVVVPGIMIGTGAVIGANSVVTHDVPPYAIVAGAPARVIRQRFPTNLVEKLLATEWWEYAAATLRRMPVKNVFDFVEGIAAIRASGSVGFATRKSYRLE